MSITIRSGLFFFLLVAKASFGQLDFDNYRTLQSVGNVPVDFASATYVKIDSAMLGDVGNINDDLAKRKFLESTRYAIDELLHSGSIIYGDAISSYVEEIADKLLKNDPDLRAQLRFYTLKSTETNAFSTDQGIIVVTTGLISQLENEAQLAYVLAHEIVHYTQHHVVETFKWQKEKKYSHDWVSELSKYSQENEFEADLKAIELYKNAGYNKEEMESVFDVLLYADLPFDILPIDLDYFSTEKNDLPSYLFPAEDFAITADENINDSRSTHPNIARRRAAVREELLKYPNGWGSDIFQFGENRFSEIRSIARFESLRMEVLNTNFGKALYIIFLLETEYPNSMYLKRMKAQTWLGIYQYEKIGRGNSVISKKSNYQGESAKVHYMLKEADRKIVTTLSLRTIYDLKQENPSDLEIDLIYKAMIRELANDSKFSMENYSKISFSEALSDTTTLITTEKTKPKSKYERISEKETGTLGAGADSTGFYIYSLYDLKTDPVFLDLLSKEVVVELAPKSYSKNKKNDHLKINVDDFIVVEPRVLSISKYGVDNVRSEFLESRFNYAYAEGAEYAGTNIHLISSSDLKDMGAQGYNQRNTLMSYFQQVLNNEKIQPFPVDFELSNEVSQSKGCSKIMFSYVTHNFDIDINWIAVATSLGFTPVAPFFIPLHVPQRLMRANTLTINVLVIDMSTGKILLEDRSLYEEPLGKHHLSAHLYRLFKLMSETSPLN